MSKKKTKTTTLTSAVRAILSSVMPDTEGPAALDELGIVRTGAALAAYGVFQKAEKGDPSAAKFLKELNGEEEPQTVDSAGAFRSFSDALLMKLAGITSKELDSANDWHG